MRTKHTHSRERGPDAAARSRYPKSGPARPASPFPFLSYPGPYPTSYSLQFIREWRYTDLDGLMEFIRDDLRWDEHGRMWHWRKRWTLATGGWSGNEEILGALRENQMVWAMYWQKSERGGLVVFEKEAK